MRHLILHLDLPQDWQEFPSDNGRLYRRKIEGSGFFRVSLLPPTLPAMTDGPTVLKKLLSILREVDMPVGNVVYAEHWPCKAGMMAHTLRKLPKVGLMKYWLIPCETCSIFATYDMGSLETVKQELLDMQHTMEEAYFEEVSGQDAMHE
jgi:hypothetical protein